MSSASKMTTSASSKLYILLWSLLACASIGYIVHLSNTQTFQQSQTQSQKNFALKAELEQKQFTELKAELTTAKSNLNQLNRKNQILALRLNQLEKKLNRKAQQNDKFQTQLRKLENTIGLVTGALQKEQISKRSELSTTKIETIKGVELPIKKSNLPEPPLNLSLKNNDYKQPQKTSIQQTSFAVALGNYKNLTQLKKAWSRLNKKHKTELEQLHPRYLQVKVNKKTQYELLLGPLKNLLDAAKICYRLNQAKTYCKQSIFQGKTI